MESDLVAAELVDVSVAILALSLVAVVGAPAAVAAPASAPADQSAAVAPTSGPPPIVHVMDEKERVALQQTDNVRLSLPTQDDVEAWRAPGFRLQLGYGYGIVNGTGAAFSFRSQTVMVRPSVRLDGQWSLGMAMLYGTGPGGLRWSVTAEPTYHPWRQLAVSVGIGFGGLLLSDSGASPGTLKGSTVTASRDVMPGENLTSCDGSALTSGVRVEYLFVAGPLFASGPFAQANAQWTRCTATFGSTDQETGRPIVLSQWWRQQGGTFGWWFAWR